MNQNTGSSPTYESISECAKRIGVHPNTLRNRIAEGKLTAYRFGPRLLKLKPAEVDALMRPIPCTRTAP